MRISIPKEDIPVQLVGLHYKSLMDMHMIYEKMRFSSDYSYIKYAGFFVIASFGLVGLDRMNVNSNYLLGILFAGIGMLLVLAMNMIFISAGIDSKCARFLEEGALVEEKYQSLINFHYFQASDVSRSARYRASLFKRLFPFVFVGSLTIWAGTSLTLMISASLAITTGIGGTVLLMTTTVFLTRVIKRHQLLIGKEGS